MKRTILIASAALALAASGFGQAQSAEDSIEKALLAAPPMMKDGATVIRWKSDYTYETLRKGTNRLVCFDRSGQPGQQPFAAECTSIANLDRVAQNLKFEAIADRAERQKALDAAEKDGTRVKPEFGSVWYHVMGPDKDHLRSHETIAVPGATQKTLGLPENPQQGGAWIMNAGTTTAHIMTPGR